MAKDTNIGGSGIDGYITSVRGTATYFIREAVINTEDLVDFEAAKTDAADNAGSQQINVGGVIALGSELIGAANGTYTMTVNIDGTDYAVSVDVLLASTDWDALVTAINADLPGTECAIDASDNLTITSSTTGNDSIVRITDGTLLAALPDFVRVENPVDGDVAEALKLQTLDNGANAYAAYSPAIEVVDSADNYTVINSAYVVSDLNATFSDTEVEAEFGLVKAKLDALQALVKELINRG